jgi:hypothetical protein
MNPQWQAWQGAVADGSCLNGGKGPQMDQIGFCSMPGWGNWNDRYIRDLRPHSVSHSGGVWGQKFAKMFHRPGAKQVGAICSTVVVERSICND